MRIAYLDCFSGISGDMFLAALLDCGVPEAVFQRTVAALNSAAGLDARLDFRHVNRSGIQAAKADVLICANAPDETEPHPGTQAVSAKNDQPRVEHDHPAHHHGHTHSHAHEAVLGEAHAAENSHHEGSSPHHAHACGLSEIRAIILQLDIGEPARERALAIFQALGEAEAKIHGIPVADVHFHEVGAADALVDIVCAAVGSLALNVDEWICSPINLGSGTIECAHGRFPVPAPATAELLKNKNAPVFSSGIQAELVTPTGAAIVKVLAHRFAALPPMKTAAIGYGAGSRDFDRHPNVLRLMVGEAAAEHAVFGAAREEISVLECTVDDLNPQIIGYVLERARAAGALDSFVLPVQMKKSRPGALITVLAKPAHEVALVTLLLRETSSLGVRLRHEQRWILPRRQKVVNTPWGPVHVKLAAFDGKVASAAPEFSANAARNSPANAAPEFEDCRALAERHNLPLKQVMQAALQALAHQQDEDEVEAETEQSALAASELATHRKQP